MFALLSIACALPPERQDSEGALSTEPINDDPALSITFPVTSASVQYCPQFLVTVHTENIVLTTNDAPQVNGQGHWHIRINGAESPTMVSDVPYHPVTADETNPGSNVIEAWLVDQDHQPITDESRVEIQVVDPADKKQLKGCVGDP